MEHLLCDSIMRLDHQLIEYHQARGNPIIPRGAPYEGERFERFAAMATEGKRHGSLMVGQISHPGRQVSEDIQPHPISASDVQLKGKMPSVLNRSLVQLAD